MAFLRKRSQGGWGHASPEKRHATARHVRGEADQFHNKQQIKPLAPTGYDGLNHPYIIRHLRDLPCGQAKIREGKDLLSKHLAAETRNNL